LAKRTALLLAAAVAVAMLSGCGKKESTENGKIEVEVAIFQGGYGLDFFEYAAREYEKMHPDVKIKIWGNPRIWEQLRPRFVAGDPPDLTWPGWGMDTWALVYEAKAMEMDKYLETKAYGQDKRWKDTFVTGALEKGRYNGHYYTLPFTYNVFGWWYNVNMFEKHGWKPPATYEELISLCAKIKKTGVAPITFQGKYPQYMLQGFLIPWAISAGGMEAWRDAQNLVPGAWNGPAFLKAAQMVEELGRKGYFQKGAMGMSHTEAQMEFLLGHAAMIPCGTWLGSEMKKQMPPGFRMQYFNAPVLKDGKGDPSITSTGTEPWLIPSEAKHPDIAADFFKFMTSLEMAKKFVLRKNTLVAVVDSDDVELPPDLVTPARLLREASDTWSSDYGDWYKQFGDATEDIMAALLNAEVTPKECVDRIEKAAAKVRKDKSIPKHKVD